MKKLLATAAIVGATIFGATNIAGASAPAKNPLPRTWTPTAEVMATTLLKAEPKLAAYDTDCVLRQIEDEFTSPRVFVKHAKSGNSPRVYSVAMDIVINCGGLS